MWKSNHLLFFDIESTGLPIFDCGKSNITEIAIHACLRKDILESRNGQLPRVIHKLILCFNPAKMIHQRASEISGLYNDMLESENTFNKNAANLILNFFQHLQHPVCLVAHNGFHFDFPVLKKTFDKLNVNIPEHILCIDSYVAIKNIDEIEEASLLYDFDKINNENVDKIKLEDNDVILNTNEVQNGESAKNILCEKDNICNTATNDFDDDLTFQKVLKQEYEKIVHNENTTDQVVEVTPWDENEIFHSIDWQKINETTPKRNSEKTLTIVDNQISNKNVDSSSSVTSPSLTKNSKESNKLPHQTTFKSRKKLLSSFDTAANSKSSPSISSRSTPYSVKQRGYYRLSSIYNRIYGKQPNVLHHAEDDVYTLQKIMIAYGEKFVQYAEKNAVRLVDIPSERFR